MRETRENNTASSTATTKIRLGVLALIGSTVLSMQSHAANLQCESALAAKSAPVTKVERSKGTLAAGATKKPAINVPALADLLAKRIQLDTKANDLGFHSAAQATRNLKREEALGLLSIALKNKKSNLDEVVADVASIQKEGFQKYSDIMTLLASAYASELKVEAFAKSLASIMKVYFVPNPNELGFQATDLRRPELREAMLLFDLVVLREGKIEELQDEILDIADILDSGDFEVISSVIHESHEQKLDSRVLAEKVYTVSQKLAIQVRRLGFQNEVETIHPSAAETIAIMSLSSQLKIEEDNLANAVADLAQASGASDYATVIGALAKSVEIADQLSKSAGEK